MKEVRILGFYWVLMMVSSCGAERKEISKPPEVSTEKKETVEKVHPGKVLYMQFCLACHMVNGEGVPGMYPPLIQTEYVLGDKERLIKTVLHGMEGPIEVKGEPYNNVMAKLDYLQDQQIADVLSYVRSNFGNQADAVTASEVQAVRSSGAK